MLRLSRMMLVSALPFAAAALWAGGAAAQISGPSISGWNLPWQGGSEPPQIEPQILPPAQPLPRPVPQPVPQPAPMTPQASSGQDGDYATIYRPPPSAPRSWGDPDVAPAPVQLPPARGGVLWRDRNDPGTAASVSSAASAPSASAPPLAAGGDDPAGRREAVIQTLIDQGYTAIDDVNPDGSGFVAYAERDGVPGRYWVDPQSGRIEALPY